MAKHHKVSNAKSGVSKVLGGGNSVAFETVCVWFEDNGEGVVELDGKPARPATREELQTLHDGYHMFFPFPSWDELEQKREPFKRAMALLEGAKLQAVVGKKSEPPIKEPFKDPFAKKL